MKISYKFLFLDHRNRSRRSAILKYRTDEFACEAVRVLFEGDPIEVWAGSRFVCRMDDRGVQLAAQP